MKNALWLLTLILAASLPLWAQTAYPPGSGTVVSIAAGTTTTGAGTTYYFSGPYNQFTWQVIISGGTATSITTNFECSLDGGQSYATWDTSTSTTGEVRSVANKPALGCRCNISAYSRNGTTAACQLAAVNSGVTFAGSVISVPGSTSGTSTITAPGVAGTATNPIVLSNSLRIPTGTVYSINADTGLSRTAADVLAIGNGTAGDTTAQVKSAAYMSVGTVATTNAGCGEGALTGGATAGKMTTAGQTSCTDIITMGNSATAPNGWQCSFTDLTTAASAANPHQTASNATTVTWVSGTIVAGDVISFACIGY
jgi:hypothetical protein